LLVCWNANIFHGSVTFALSQAISIEFTSQLSGASFHLTNIYGPCDSSEKADFINWSYNLDTSLMVDWLLVGDFNLIRSPEDRNKPGGNVAEMLLFNDLIQHLDLVDIPFEGRKFTWCNMQEDPLLEKLDWVFTSTSWTLSYPATCVRPLARPISDHVPYVVQVETHIPRASIFKFENYWADFPGFLEVVQQHWHSNPFFANMAKTISGKVKKLRTGLRKWSRELSKLNKLINNCNWVLALLDGLEDQRTLYPPESIFRNLLSYTSRTLGFQKDLLEAEVYGEVGYIWG
jgi:hypothetical protein